MNDQREHPSSSPPVYVSQSVPSFSTCVIDPHSCPVRTQRGSYLFSMVGDILQVSGTSATARAASSRVRAAAADLLTRACFPSAVAAPPAVPAGRGTV